MKFSYDERIIILIKYNTERVRNNKRSMENLDGIDFLQALRGASACFQAAENAVKRKHDSLMKREEEISAREQELAKQMATLQRWEANQESERRRIEELCIAQGDIIELNVGGFRFSTTRGTLCFYKNTFFEAMFSGRHQVPNIDGVYFIDRDGTHFRHILNFMRRCDSVSCIDDWNCLQELRVEADYYGFAEMVAHIDFHMQRFDERHPAPQDEDELQVCMADDLMSLNFGGKKNEIRVNALERTQLEWYQRNNHERGDLGQINTFSQDGSLLQSRPQSVETHSYHNEARLQSEQIVSDIQMNSILHRSSTNTQPSRLNDNLLELPESTNTWANAETNIEAQSHRSEIDNSNDVTTELQSKLGHLPSLSTGAILTSSAESEPDLDSRNLSDPQFKPKIDRTTILMMYPSCTTRFTKISLRYLDLKKVSFHRIMVANGSTFEGSDMEGCDLRRVTLQPLGSTTWVRSSEDCVHVDDTNLSFVQFPEGTQIMFPRIEFPNGGCLSGCFKHSSLQIATSKNSADSDSNLNDFGTYHDSDGTTIDTRVQSARTSGDHSVTSVGDSEHTTVSDLKRIKRDLRAHDTTSTSTTNTGAGMQRRDWISLQQRVQVHREILSNPSSSPAAQIVSVSLSARTLLPANNADVLSSQENS